MIILKKRSLLWKKFSVISDSIQLFSSKKEMFTKRTQPPWSPPPRTPGVELPNLTLSNSLTGRKDPFVPEKGRDVQWYCCGPTVYDASHMGHARSYITFDILRRVLRDYFKFNIKYVMNITDIDDKIIKRARQNYLFGEYAKTKTDEDLDYIANDVKISLEKLRSKFGKEADRDKKAMYGRDIERLEMALKSDSSKSASVLLEVAKDALSDLLDSKFGSTVTSNDVFKDLPRRFEDEFQKDMEALNIEPPDLLIRVSDVVPDIVDYCIKLIENGFGYESNGSVYFDTIKFSNAPGHFYAKLVPTAFGDQDQLQEGEGILTDAAKRLGEKRNPSDFALWKASKPGEPGWESPWGRGRPGWHIECSVMASSACGPSMDIHTGGIDLKFPHHDNELAQSEAYFGHSHWVRYFLHAGHLTIAGCKMSKSLKNFITIREALNKHSSRRLRLAFLLHSWKDTLDYSAETMSEAVSYERMLQIFFFNVRHFERLSEGGQLNEAALDEMDLNLQQKIRSMIQQVDERMCDSVDTRGALTIVQDLISQCNIYIRNCLESKTSPKSALLKEAAVFITKLMRIFGCGSAYSDNGDIGLEEITADQVRKIAPILFSILHNFNKEVQAAAEKEKSQTILSITKQLDEKVVNAFGTLVSDGDTESLHSTIDKSFAHRPNKDPVIAINPLLTIIAEHREAVRAEARQSKLVSILKLSDHMRDEVLARNGVRLEDREEGPAIGVMNQQFLDEDRTERQALEELRNKNKEEQLRNKERQAAEKNAQMKIPPSELFRKETDKYSAFGERGLPTHDAKGNQITKSQLKKLQKMYDAQEKKHNEYLKSQEASLNGR